MKAYKYSKLITVLVGLSSLTACTKLDQKLNNTLTQSEAANSFNAALFLQGAYTDIGNPWSDLGNIFALEEVTSDECVVPTRSSDWDDNGKWRALKQHTWNTDGVDIFLSMFNALNKIQFDATNVLTFKPSASQAAQARFVRALALYQILDLFGQYPFRDPGENLLNAPKVLRGDSAIDFIISELTTVLPDLPAGSKGGNISVATQDAGKVLLMRAYLNRGALLNRANPTWPDADMQKVITLGNEIINSGHYSYDSVYFHNFAYNNSSSPEGIFAIANVSGVATNNSGINNRWYAPLHYNQYTPKKGAAGWNGFSTVASTYDMFQTNGNPTARYWADSAIDVRIGQRFYPGVTDSSGVRPGFLIGQQYDEKGVKEFDRHNHLLVFNPAIVQNLKETDTNNLELKGIRVIKYPPDYSQTVKSYDAGGNWMMIFRYPEVVLMVAEAKLRATATDAAGALLLVNNLRTARKAVPLASLPLVNTANVYDPKTLLAERGRELYWESLRRTDLIRFGMFLKAWEYKAASDQKYLLFPLPTESLAANPNLIQNPGFTQ
jgi:hypothetical protein